MSNDSDNSLLTNLAGAALISFHLLLSPLLRTYRACWGAELDDLLHKLPGDDLVTHARWEFTHAITINAPTAEVWSWLVQIGVGRGGLYSYEGLENLAGCRMHNADDVIPAYQQLKPGDEIKIHPKAPGMRVAAVEPGHYILVHNDNRQDGSSSYINMTWLWYLQEVSATQTRLISRSRNDYSPSLANKLWMGPLLVEPISFVMERRMLLGIKQRAESHWMAPLHWAYEKG
ncbi:MAG TPA: hypothetical protein VHD90_15780 [Phototrophicaceae bacterium]|nr:hypothetical protein [Phototrophicaceae bacterium]